MTSEEQKSPRDLVEEKRANDRTRIIDALRPRATDEQGVGCFLCAWIISDFERNGKLTDFPYDLNDKGIFPYLGKVAHIRLEAPKLDVKVGIAV